MNRKPPSGNQPPAWPEFEEFCRAWLEAGGRIEARHEFPQPDFSVTLSLEGEHRSIRQSPPENPAAWWLRMRRSSEGLDCVLHPSGGPPVERRFSLPASGPSVHDSLSALVGLLDAEPAGHWLFEARVMEAVLRLLIGLAPVVGLPSGNLGVDAPGPPQVVRDLLESVRRGPNAPGALSEAASRHGIRSRYLARLFQSWNGESFHDHLTLVRLLAARQDLARTSASVEEIGLRAGFASRDVFIRSFRRYFVDPPLQFRKAWRALVAGTGEAPAALRLADALPVEWLDDAALLPFWRVPGKDDHHALFLGNGTNDVRIARSLRPEGRRVILEPGALVMEAGDPHDSVWMVEDAEARRTGWFSTPNHRCLALIRE